jgi:phosphoribosylanthranilate isomerase
MKIDKVTITGADDNVKHQDLRDIQTEFPFVEWGILFSESKEGTDRYPSKSWVHDMITYSPKNISAHICGKYMRDILVGDEDIFFNDMFAHAVWESFSRVQLNFNVKNSDINLLEFFHILKTASTHYEIEKFLFQGNHNNKEFIKNVLLPYSHANKLIGILFDASGGNGVIGEWQAPYDLPCGYAGGLTPDNLEEELLKIEGVVGDKTIWIDAETGIRTDNKLDLDKVRKFLTIAKKYTC